jgi:drug/metabolite transporter (DMT)-like permease
VSSASRFIPSGLVSMIIATEVPIIAVVASVLLPDRPLTPRTLAGAALGLVGVAFLFSGKGAGETHLLACAAVVGGALCWSLGAVKHVRAEAVATHVFINPLVAVALGAWLAGEELRPVHLISGVLILASVAVIVFARRSRA